MTITVANMGAGMLSILMLCVPVRIFDGDPSDGTILPWPNTSCVVPAFAAACIVHREGVVSGDEVLLLWVNILSRSGLETVG